MNKVGSANLRSFSFPVEFWAYCCALMTACVRFLRSSGVIATKLLLIWGAGTSCCRGMEDEAWDIAEAIS